MRGSYSPVIYGPNGIKPLANSTIIHTVSDSFALSTSGYLSTEWALMVNNSVSLTVGRWKVSGFGRHAESTGAWTGIYNRWGSANGDNTTGLPAGTASGNFTFVYGTDDALFAPLDDDLYMATSTIILDCTADDVLYLNSQATFSSAGAANMRVYILAELIG